MSEHVEVRRTGGFIGRPVTGRVSLDPSAAYDDAVVAEVQSLVERLSFDPIPSGRRHPDMFHYAFSVGERTMVCADHQLPSDLQPLATLGLENSEERRAGNTGLRTGRSR